MNKKIEYDKRIGIPDFNGWEEREIEAFKQSGLSAEQYFNDKSMKVTKKYFDTETIGTYQDQSKPRLERESADVKIIMDTIEISNEVKRMVDKKFEEIEAFYEFMKLQEVFKNQKL